MILIQDNGRKLKINTSVEEIEFYCKKILNWRTPTKKYKTIFERYCHSGSSNHDKVIEMIFKKNNGSEC